MKYLLIASFASLLATTAFAAEISKTQQTAEFRVKAAVCKAQAKGASIALASSEFYTYMGTCLDRVNVAVSITPSTGK
jgi:hypothetical protein